MKFLHSTQTGKSSDWARMTIPSIAIVCLILSAYASVTASNHYTDKQLDALAERVGKIYWTNVNSQNAKPPTFLSGPAANAPTFSAGGNESFEITELVGRQLFSLPNWKYVEYVLDAPGYDLESPNRSMHQVFLGLFVSKFCEKREQAVI